MDLERAIHEKSNRITVALVQSLISSTMLNAVWVLGEITEVIPDTEYRCDFLGKTPVQFDAVYCVMKK